MTTEVIGVVSTSFLAFVSIIVGGWVGRRAGLRQADAAVAGAEASAKEAVTADWKSFSDSLQSRLGAVEARAAATEVRLDAAEQRAVAAEQRAGAAEGQFQAAVRYLRQIAAWFAERWPTEQLPPPPAELEGEL